MLLSPSRVFASRSHAFSTLYTDVTFSIAFTASGQVFAGGGGCAGVGDGAAVVVGAGVVVAAALQGHHAQPLQRAGRQDTCSTAQRESCIHSAKGLRMWQLMHRCSR